MKSSNKTIILNHNARDLFDIVLDLEKYPEFIPWCHKMIINSKNTKEIFADMYVFYKFIYRQKFGSHVVFDKKKLLIKTIYIDGPLKDLKTNWQFFVISNSKTKLNFHIKFEFKKFIHQKIAETFYPLIETKMIDSFKKRADKILN